MIINFAVIPRVAKWHGVLFEGALLIKITNISKLFCIQIVPHWSTNQECGSNRGNTMYNTRFMYSIHYCYSQKFSHCSGIILYALRFLLFQKLFQHIISVHYYGTVTLTTPIATHPIINYFSDVHIGYD